jgi:hypothetical protein
MNPLTQKALQIGLSPAGIATVRAEAKKHLSAEMRGLGLQ